MPQPSPQPNVLAGEEVLPFGVRFWLLLVPTGVGTGIAAGLLMKLLRAAQHLGYAYSSGIFLYGVEGTSALRRVVVLACAGALTGGVLWGMNRAGGEGTGGLSAAIWFRSGRLQALRNFATGALSITIVGLGASLGREAAPKEYGATIGSKLCEWAGLSRAERRILAACGAGAGMAAVYNVPLGGALFGLEVLLGRLDLPLVLPAIATAMIATATSWLLIPNRATYSVPRFPLSLQQIVWAAAAGPVLGLIAVLYVRAIAWAAWHKPKGLAVALTPLPVFAAVGAVAIVYPQILGNGKDVVQLALTDRLTLPLLGALVVLKPVVTAGSLRTGAPGGLFTPTMTLGALAGGLMGKAWNFAWPGVPAGSCALIGSAAMLAAATQGPVSSLVLVSELTRQLNPVLIPAMVAVASAGVVTRALESRSVYSGRVPVHLPAAAPVEAAAALHVEPAQTISAAAPYVSVVERFLRLPAGAALEVIDESGAPAGTITRDRIDRCTDEFGTPRYLATAFDLAPRAPSPPGRPDYRNRVWTALGRRRRR